MWDIAFFSDCRQYFIFAQSVNNALFQNSLALHFRTLEGLLKFPTVMAKHLFSHLYEIFVVEDKCLSYIGCTITSAKHLDGNEKKIVCSHCLT